MTMLVDPIGHRMEISAGRDAAIVITCECGWSKWLGHTTTLNDLLEEQYLHLPMTPASIAGCSRRR